MCTYDYTYVYIYTYIQIYIYTYIHIYISTYMCIHIYIYMDVMRQKLRIPGKSVDGILVHGIVGCSPTNVPLWEIPI